MLTGHGAASTASAKVINDGGVTLDGTVNGEVAAESGVGDLVVLEVLDCNLDRVDS